MAIASNTSKYSYHLTPQAYILPLLHAAKNLSSTTNGVFLGRIEEATVTIEDAVPLLHNYTSLTPMMEIGMEMAEVYGKEKGLTIVGYYQANNGEDVSLGRVGERVLDVLKGKWDGAFGMVVSLVHGWLGNGPEEIIHIWLFGKPLNLRTGRQYKVRIGRTSICCQYRTSSKTAIWT